MNNNIGIGTANKPIKTVVSLPNSTTGNPQRNQKEKAKTLQ